VRDKENGIIAKALFVIYILLYITIKYTTRFESVCDQRKHSKNNSSRLVVR